MTFSYGYVSRDGIDLKTIVPTRYCSRFDPEESPAFTVEDEETVLFFAEHAAVGALTFDSTGEDVAKHGSRGHALTGPVAIKGAKPGDVLRIDIIETQSGDWGWCKIAKGKGQLPERGDHFAFRSCRIDPEDRMAHFADGIRIPTAPFYGVMGTTPRDAISTAYPGPHGGNMDCKELCAPATLFLPVLVENALFLAGDGHAVQGNGEVSIAGLECAVKSKLRFSIERDMHLEGPFIEKPSAWIFLAFADTLDEAAADVTRQALSFLEREKGLSADDAYVLASFVLDLCITQVVDPLVGVHGILPKHVFESER